jgi:hypothetical protein
MAHIEHNHSEDTTELLSAYVDNALNITERHRAETLINHCSGCAQEVQELRLLKQWLGAMPEVRPRRSFRIQPIVKEPRRLIFPVLRWATVAATVLLLLVVGADLVQPNGAATEATNGDTSMAAQAEPEAAEAPELAPAGEAAPPAADTGASPAAEEAEAPPEDRAPEVATPEAAAAAEAEPAADPVPEAEMRLEATPQESPPLAEPEVGGAATTVDAARDAIEQQQEPFTTLRIAQIVLLVITIGLALAAAWTQYKHI